MVTDQPSHDVWFRARVQEALADPRPSIPHDEVEAHMARRRQTLRQLLAAPSA